MDSLTRQGQFEKAIETYDKAIKVNHDFTEGWFRIVHTVYNNDQHDLAIQYFDQAIKIDPRHTDAYIGKVFTSMILERLVDAPKNADASVQTYPDKQACR
ncbi:MAG: tetratricopeptide repeat protein [Nitrosopumilus sp.]|nr:MAG: tetratricopeptide repeat protein [Nitrosopumilus sp.]